VPKPDLIVARHLPTTQNERGISRGWLSTGIDRKTAEPLAEKAAKALNAQGVDTLVSSDLPRAEQSTKLIAEKMGGDVRTSATSRLRTWNTGDDVAGKPEKETIPLRQKYLKNSEIEMPGGESWDEFMSRFGTELHAIERRRAKGENVALVGHGHHIMAVPELLGGQKVDPKKLATLDSDYEPGGVYGFHKEGNNVRVERLDKGETPDAKEAAR
jgi:broad specificity phosphatase PhoE